MNGGVRVDITSRWEVWDYIEWRVVWEVTSHHDEKCEIVWDSVRLYSMNGGVRVDITSRWEVWDYIEWRVVWEVTSHHDEKCETILNEEWCERWHHITMRSVRLYSMNGGVWVYTLVADRSVMAAWLLSLCVAMCVERCGFATWCCRTHCNGCMDVAWASFWGSQGRKPCVFPCKVAPAGDERYLLCAAGAAGVEPGANRFLLCVLQQVVVHVCVILFVSWLSGCRSHCNGCMIVGCHMCVERCGFGTWCCQTHCNGLKDVAWASFLGKAGAGNLVLFRVKWLRPAMKGTSCTLCKLWR